MLINFALTGVFGEDDFSEKNDYFFKGKIASTIWVLLNQGAIASIEGLDELKADDSVVFVMERFKQGDIVKEEWVGTERQVFARIYIVSDSINELNEKIDDFHNKLKIRNIEGKNMILEWVKPFNPKQYKFTK